MVLVLEMATAYIDSLERKVHDLMNGLEDGQMEGGGEDFDFVSTSLLCKKV